MYKKTIQRRFVTLIEMMIVMFLIALITGVIAYNYRGSLDEGKAFKTKAGIEKLETILNLEAAKNPQAANQILSDWQSVVKASPFVHDPNSLIRDGWGEEYQVAINPDTGGIYVFSRKYEEYKKSHNTLFQD
jgi:general secretion pathway protein G